MEKYSASSTTAVLAAAIFSSNKNALYVFTCSAQSPFDSMGVRKLAIWLLPILADARVIPRAKLMLNEPKPLGNAWSLLEPAARRRAGLKRSYPLLHHSAEALFRSLRGTFTRRRRSKARLRRGPPKHR